MIVFEVLTTYKRLMVSIVKHSDENDLIEFMTVYNNKEVNNDQIKDEVELVTADLIREGLKFATNMEQHFLLMFLTWSVRSKFIMI